MNWINFIAPVVAVVCALVLISSIRIYQRKVTAQQQKLSSFELLTKRVVKSNESLNKQLVEVHAANYAMAHRIADLESMVEQTMNRQNEIVTQDPDSKLYSRAVKMVELGADIEEVMRECELPRAEAQLLYTLHGKPLTK
ncbi:DUF2802 domain-containing protein [Celerinatantimonas sp. MCCC 1A17872]|uniref:DUF2802 domain-containing protein n=1 Tax=Celerinatantimonas sp. MCCC 1A17872 TaxID=3177514 RepID=UPI0038C06FBB